MSNNNLNTSSSTNEANKEYLSTSFFLLRKYVREKRADVQKVQREDGPMVDRNSFLMKLTEDTLQLLTDLDANITNFEINLKSKHKKIDEKLKLINNQRTLLRQQPKQVAMAVNGRNGGGDTSFPSDQADRINVSNVKDSRVYQNYLPNGITIEPVQIPGPPPLRRYPQALNNPSGRPVVPNTSSAQTNVQQPGPIVMRFGIPKNNNPLKSYGTVRIIKSTVSPTTDEQEPSPPRSKGDLSLTQCPFCPDQRFFNFKSTLMRHVNEEHPEFISVYNDIFSLTPESYVSNSSAISGTSQCFYCSVLFRSKAPLLRHIQEEHHDNYTVFESVANLKGLKLKNLITRPTIAQNCPPSKPEGLLIFNPAIDPSLASHVPADLDVKPIITNRNNIPGQGVNFATPPTSVQRHPNHAAKTCQSPAVSANHVVQPARRVTSVTTSSTPPKVVPVVSTSKSPIVTDSSRGRTDHEYSNTAVKRPATETKSPSPVRKTAKQQAEAIKSRYPCSKCPTSFSTMNALTLHLGFYCTARTQEEKAAVAGLQPTLPLNTTPSTSEPRIFIAPEKREELARAISPALSRASASSRASNGQALCNASSSSEPLTDEGIIDEEVLLKSISDFRIELKEMKQVEILECMKSDRTKKLLNLNCKK